MKTAAYCAAVSIGSTTIGNLIPIETAGGVIAVMVLAVFAAIGGSFFEDI